VSDVNKEIARLTLRSAKGFACIVNVSAPWRAIGVGGASPLVCSFCGVVIASMGGPGAGGTACLLCSNAILDAGGPLGELLREAWLGALRGAVLKGEQR
jgi:hypothetical protein